MIRLFINSLAASAGGGLTYIRNVIPHLAALADVRTTIAVSPLVLSDFQDDAKIDFLELEIPSARRFWFEQRTLPEVIRKSGADVLLSAGNFALRRSPIPQILLSRNSIYTSRDFLHDLLLRREYRMWLDTRMRAVLARKSVHWADVTVAPSTAFARELERWTDRRVSVIYHGFDREAFVRDLAPLPLDVRQKLDAARGGIKILFVSHYNYYRNFETLIKSLPILRTRFPGTPIRLLLTCELAAGKNPGAYHPDSTVRLIGQLGVSDMVIELGAIPYPKLHHLYSLADVCVAPAYTETFAHPLVEAMSSGVPIVASDIAVHREICREAARYFTRFSPDALANSVAVVIEMTDVKKAMVAAGLSRASHFSWKRHVEQIIELSEKLIGRSKC
jgi:glycosyltransferase involved in cell wall biosynthesis